MNDSREVEGKHEQRPVFAGSQIFWLKDDRLDDVDSLPPPDEIAAEIVENLQAALEAFQAVAEDLARRPRRDQRGST